MIVFFHNISLTTVLIVGSSITCFTLTVLLIAGLTVKWKNGRRRRRVKQQELQQQQATEIPEEYITYRHFSLPSSEHVYS